jgi:dTDP-4-amino-4,6-dideoxygalactose transaminase
VIEDAAHRLAPLGDNHGDYVCWSHQAIKFLTTVDGGTLLCPPQQHDRAKKLRWFGLDRSLVTCEQDIAEVGYKYAMNDVDATIGICNLPDARAAVDVQASRAERYCATFQDLPGVTVAPFDPDCSYWLFTILVDDRVNFIAFAKSRGIAVGQVHRRNDTLTGMRALPAGELPGLDAFASRQVAIPVGWWMDSEDEGKVLRCVQNWAIRSALGTAPTYR